MDTKGDKKKEAVVHSGSFNLPEKRHRGALNEMLHIKSLAFETLVSSWWPFGKDQEVWTYRRRCVTRDGLTVLKAHAVSSVCSLPPAEVEM